MTSICCDRRNQFLFFHDQITFSVDLHPAGAGATHVLQMGNLHVFSWKASYYSGCIEHRPALNHHCLPGQLDASLQQKPLKRREDPCSLSADIFITRSICSWGDSDRRSQGRRGFRAAVSEWRRRRRRWGEVRRWEGCVPFIHRGGGNESAVRITTPGQKNPSTPLRPLWECGFLHTLTHWDRGIMKPVSRFVFLSSFCMRTKCHL